MVLLPPFLSLESWLLSPAALISASLCTYKYSRAHPGSFHEVYAGPGHSRESRDMVLRDMKSYMSGAEIAIIIIQEISHGCSLAASNS